VTANIAASDIKEATIKIFILLFSGKNMYLPLLTFIKYKSQWRDEHKDASCLAVNENLSFIQVYENKTLWW